MPNITSDAHTIRELVNASAIVKWTSNGARISHRYGCRCSLWMEFHSMFNIIRLRRMWRAPVSWSKHLIKVIALAKIIYIRSLPCRHSRLPVPLYHTLSRSLFDYTILSRLSCTLTVCGRIASGGFGRPQRTNLLFAHPIHRTCSIGLTTDAGCHRRMCAEHMESICCCINLFPFSDFVSINTYTYGIRYMQRRRRVLVLLELVRK